MGNGSGTICMAMSGVVIITTIIPGGPGSPTTTVSGERRMGSFSGCRWNPGDGCPIISASGYGIKSAAGCGFPAPRLLLPGCPFTPGGIIAAGDHGRSGTGIYAALIIGIPIFTCSILNTLILLSTLAGKSCFAKKKKGFITAG